MVNTSNPETFDEHPSCCSRRGFLNGVMGAGLASGLGSLFDLASAQEGSGQEGPIFVLIHQAGGNDSLNTVVPYDTDQSEFYYTARPNLGLHHSEVLPLGDGIGLHPSLVQLKNLWDSGELAIVNGVGYENPQLSHFKNIDIWASGSTEALAESGWLGRFFDHQCSGDECDGSFVGIEAVERSSLNFRGKNLLSSLTMKSPALFKFQSDLGSSLVPEGFDDALSMTWLREMNQRQPADHHLVLDYVRASLDVALQGASSVEKMLEASDLSRPVGDFPNSAIGGDLSNIASYINGGATASTYFAVQGGYDTHHNQYVTDSAGRPLRGRHSVLLADFDEAIGAFAREMKRQGQWHRVLLMSYSEFSRKIPENGNHGTDHGAAGSIFLAGGALESGFFGEMPKLIEDQRIMNHSMAPVVDFRQVYRTVLERWFHIPSQSVESILRIPEQSHPSLGFLKA